MFLKVLIVFVISSNLGIVFVFSPKKKKKKKKMAINGV